MGKRKEYSYDIDNPLDRVMILDQPFSSLNKRGRKAKRKLYRRKRKK